MSISNFLHQNLKSGKHYHMDTTNPITYINYVPCTQYSVTDTYVTSKGISHHRTKDAETFMAIINNRPSVKGKLMRENKLLVYNDTVFGYSCADSNELFFKYLTSHPCIKIILCNKPKSVQMLQEIYIKPKIIVSIPMYIRNNSSEIILMHPVNFQFCNK